MADSEDPNKKLYVSNALHKADIEISEEGIKSVAVTVFPMGDGASMRTRTYPHLITFDKPFIFIIRDKNIKDLPKLYMNPIHEKMMKRLISQSMIIIFKLNVDI